MQRGIRSETKWANQIGALNKTAAYNYGIKQVDLLELSFFEKFGLGLLRNTEIWGSFLQSFTINMVGSHLPTLILCKTLNFAKKLATTRWANF